MKDVMEFSETIPLECAVELDLSRKKYSDERRKKKYDAELYLQNETNSVVHYLTRKPACLSDYFQ